MPLSAAPPDSRAARKAIVIAGGGIGGLTAALSLSAAGYAVVVAERSAEISEGGAGIQIAPNAGRVLADLGLDAALAAAATEPAAITIHGAGGRVVTTIPGAAFRARYDFPYRVIHRSDLHAIIVAAVRADPAIRFETGAVVAALRPHANGIMVRVAMRGGVEGIDAAAFVAADGVHSSFRETIGGSATAVATGRTAWRATIAADAAPASIARDSVGVWLGQDAHVVHYPVARGTAVNIVAIVEDHWAGTGWSAAGDGQALLQRLAAWPEALRDLLKVPAAWQKFAIAAVDPAGRWSDGRVVLLGDAAHAMVPFLAQGAAMAIEDAAVLSAYLDGASDIPAALTAYEAARKPRVRRVAAAAERTGVRYHYGPVMALARDTALRIAGRRLILGGNDWLYSWRPPSRERPRRLMTPMRRSSQ